MPRVELGEALGRGVVDAVGAVDAVGGPDAVGDAEGAPLVVADGGALLIEPLGRTDALAVAGAELLRAVPGPVVRLTGWPGVGVFCLAGVVADADGPGAGNDSRSSGPVSRNAATSTSTA
ncbi:hypothetical protein AB0J72_08135 [Dactylosporangium sp. NPDC049742]|uniref:hypothetical protein n=1 Tax=Dactylosporangium sp. NPDC049742 TaxID=3154737 RepID=UPI003444F19D